VLDFGLVRREYAADASSLSAEPPLVGTPAYMAPETILGQQPDCRVDIYAVGCLLRFLLTGEPVFNGRNHLQLLLQHLKEPPTPPSQSSERPIPSAIDDLVLACLQKDPACRPTSVDEVARRATTEISGEVWDERAARQWWETHLPDSCGWSVRTPAPPSSDSEVKEPPSIWTSDSEVEPHPGSIWIIPPWRD